MAISCFCDFDPAEVYCDRMVKARKQHVCEECNRPILPGEKYEYVWAIWEGWPGTFKTCSDCLDLRKWMQINIPCFCWAHGGLHESVREMAQEAHYQAPDEVVGLRFGALRRIVKIRNKAREMRKAAA